jgi:hypothetical protein
MKYVFLISLLSIMLCTGCQVCRSLWADSGPNVDPPSSGSEVMVQTIVKYDKMFGFFLLAVVGGVIAGMGGLKFGWIVAAGNLVGIGMYLTIARYSQWIAVGGLISGILILVAFVVRDKRFAFQNVKAIQDLKSKFPDLKDEINKIMFVHQDTSTEKVVKETKKKIEKQELKENLQYREKVRRSVDSDSVSTEVVSIPRKG